MKARIGMALALFLVCNTGAEVVAGWDVDGVDLDGGIGVETNSYPYTFLATASETGRVVAKLTLGDGVNPSTSADEYGFKISSSDATNSLAGAIAKNHFIQLSVEIAEGCSLDLQSLEIKGQSSSLGCSNIVLMTSIDGFESGQEIASAFPANKTGGFDTDGSGFGAPIDLSGARYQGLEGMVVFRLYGWDSTSGSSATYIRDLAGDDLVLNGTINGMADSSRPVLSLLFGSGSASISATFDGVAPTNYVLQYCADLSSGDWMPISGIFASNSDWQVEATNRCGYYRAVAQ